MINSRTVLLSCIKSFLALIILSLSPALSIGGVLPLNKAGYLFKQILNGFDWMRNRWTVNYCFVRMSRPIERYEISTVSTVYVTIICAQTQWCRTVNALSLGSSTQRHPSGDNRKTESMCVQQAGTQEADTHTLIGQEETGEHLGDLSRPAALVICRLGFDKCCDPFINSSLSCPSTRQAAEQ